MSLFLVLSFVLVLVLVLCSLRRSLARYTGLHARPSVRSDDCPDAALDGMFAPTLYSMLDAVLSPTLARTLFLLLLPFLLLLLLSLTLIPLLLLLLLLQFVIIYVSIGADVDSHCARQRFSSSCAPSSASSSPPSASSSSSSPTSQLADAVVIVAVHTHVTPRPLVHSDVLRYPYFSTAHTLHIQVTTRHTV